MNNIKKLYEIFNIIDTIKRLCVSLDDDLKFNHIILNKPKSHNSELGFYQFVAWLYVFYFEAGKANIEFLDKQLKSYGLETEEIVYHLINVKSLRTYLQHNMNEEKTHDSSIIARCEEWFLKKCKTKIPNSIGHWDNCFDFLIEESYQYLNKITECIGKIEVDESKEEIVKSWVNRKKKYFTPDQVEQLINEIASDIGRPQIDAIKIRLCYHQKWIDALTFYLGDSPEKELRKHIEKILLTDLSKVIPITGDDIINAFTISPGNKVGKILKIAMKIYDNEPCNKNVLMQKLNEHLENNPL